MVTPLGGGNYHYEYAVHNVDNDRGGATFRCRSTPVHVVSNYSFGDIDAEPAERLDRRARRQPDHFAAPANNPLNWNTIYNFGFDVNFPPGSGLATLDEARIGPGNLSVDVPTKVPSGSTFAQSTPTGEGCGGTNCQSSFYEFFSPGTSFDLANTQWSLTFNGTNYVVGPGTGTYVAPAGTSLAMSDDTEVAAAIPFSLPYPGGSTNTLWVCSNGFVSPVSNGSSFTPTPGGFLSGNPRWSALWHDLLPSTGQVRVDATASVVRVSYTGVPNFGTGGTSTFQFQFFPNGNVNVIYQAVLPQGNEVLVGWTRGGGAADPGSWNISSNLAGGLTLCSAPTPDVALASSARPVIGTTIDLNTTNIPVGTLLGLSILSTTQHIPGIDLGFLGMPGCTLYLNLDVINTFPTPSSSASVPFIVPNIPSLSGAVVISQSATLTPGINAFGFATSNALVLLLGVN